MCHEVGMLLSCARQFGLPAAEFGKEGQEFFSVTSST